MGIKNWNGFGNGFPASRKPFKYQEDAPDGGLMDFLEGKMPSDERWWSSWFWLGKVGRWVNEQFLTCGLKMIEAD